MPAALFVGLTIEQMSLSSMVNQWMQFAFAVGQSFALMLVVRWFALQTLELEVQLLHVSRAEALQCAERLRMRIAQQSVMTAAGPLSSTVSIGVALLGRPANDWKGLLNAADIALYRAKEAGRNCVKVEL